MSAAPSLAGSPLLRFGTLDLAPSQIASVYGGSRDSVPWLRILGVVALLAGFSMLAGFQIAKDDAMRQGVNYRWIDGPRVREIREAIQANTAGVVSGAIIAIASIPMLFAPWVAETRYQLTIVTSAQQQFTAEYTTLAEYAAAREWIAQAMSSAGGTTYIDARQVHLHR